MVRRRTQWFSASWFHQPTNAFVAIKGLAAVVPQRLQQTVLAAADALDARERKGHGAAMSDDAARKKHRHDLGQEDHGAIGTASTTRGIQILLGILIAATAMLVGVAAFWAGAR